MQLHETANRQDSTNQRPAKKPSTDERENGGAPKVSILLPSLNAREFLPARVASLLAQTETDWEALVLDSDSTDGTWEFFESIAASDSRFRMHRTSGDGLYAALNRGIALARGKYLNIATCDDTMAPDFLEAMIETLESCPAAGLAACDVQFIDAAGANHPSSQARDFDTVRTGVAGEDLAWLNFRPAPHDCFLHYGGRTVYFSLTQLLLRTEVAKMAPPFETNRGAIADYGWALRLTNLAGTVHLPERLSSWRLHGDQLTFRTDEHCAQTMSEMCVNAISEIRERHRTLLTRNDCAALLLLVKSYSPSAFDRMLARFEGLLRLLGMFLERPGSSWRALRAASFKHESRRNAWLLFMLRRLSLAPQMLKTGPGRFT